MTQEDYDLRIGGLKTEYRKKRSALNEEYALANNPYKIGDIIEDHYHIIKIESYGVWCLGDYPEIAYNGVELTKKLEPFKRQKNTRMFQSNVKRKY